MSIEKLDFTKVTQESIPYTILINSVIQKIPNAGALAVYVYLYSLPSNWIINKEHLKSHFGFGDDKLKEIFSYLRRANLLIYLQDKDKKTAKITGLTIHLLNGTNFDSTLIFKIKKTTGVKSTRVDKTTGGLSTRVENHTCGFRGLQKKKKYKAPKDLKKEKKSFCAKKPEADSVPVDKSTGSKSKPVVKTGEAISDPAENRLGVKNGKKHDFAASVDQMANEQRHIDAHNAIKSAPMPDSLRTFIRELK